MRWIAIALVASAFSLTAQAQPGNSASAGALHNAGIGECSVLRGATPGLLGLCRAYCAPLDQSGVDMNNIASVQRAAANIDLLVKYNALKTESDPPMPCLTEPTEPAGLPDEPPAPTSCACWTQDLLQDIDGILPASPDRSLTAGAVCTLNNSNLGIYEAQVFEGYNVESQTPTVVNSAFAYFDLNDDTVQGCMVQTPTTGISNFTLQQRAEAQYCIQTIVDQCAAIGK